MLGCLWFYMSTLQPEGEPTWINVYDDASAVEGPFSKQASLSASSG